MGLVVGRIRLLKTLICFQPIPEAGDGVVSVHILCSTEQLLCWHIAWQNSKNKLCDDSKIRIQEAGLGHML